MWDTLCCLECPDCHSACPVRYVLLTDGSQAVCLTACARCADGVTIRGFSKLAEVDYLEAAVHHLPIVHFGRRDAAR